MRLKEMADCFLPCTDIASSLPLISQLRQSNAVEHIHLLVDYSFAKTNTPPEGTSFVIVDSVLSSRAVLSMADAADTGYVLFIIKDTPIELGYHSIERIIEVAADSGATLVYGDRYAEADGKRTAHPAIDYQLGSVRDDFDFGAIVLMPTEALRSYAREHADAN